MDDVEFDELLKEGGMDFFENVLGGMDEETSNNPSDNDSSEYIDESNKSDNESEDDEDDYPMMFYMDQSPLVEASSPYVEEKTDLNTLKKKLADLLVNM